MPTTRSRAWHEIPVMTKPKKTVTLATTTTGAGDPKRKRKDPSMLLRRALFLSGICAASPTIGGAMSATPPVSQTIESRLRSALWGMFGGDALAAPAHRYYGGFPQIQSDYGRDGIAGYTQPVEHLPGSILNKSDPNGGGRRSFSVFGDRKFDKTIIGDVINHGKL